MSPMPNPMQPLMKKMGNALPESPTPKFSPNNPSKMAAKHIRQKFASVPPSSFADRFPHTADIENRIVVRNAAITRAVFRDAPPRCHAWKRQNVGPHAQGHRNIRKTFARVGHSRRGRTDCARHRLGLDGFVVTIRMFESLKFLKLVACGQDWFE